MDQKQKHHILYKFCLIRKIKVKLIRVKAKDQDYADFALFVKSELNVNGDSRPCSTSLSCCRTQTCLS